jgi:hypothetical protein
MLVKKKYFWKKQFKLILIEKILTLYENFFLENNSLFHLPSFLYEVIKKKNILIKYKREYLLVYGKVIIYKSGIIVIFLDNFKFKLEKNKHINPYSIISISHSHNLILNINLVCKFFDLIPFL